MATMAYGDFWRMGSSAATYAGYSSSASMIWSSAAIEARAQELHGRRAGGRCLCGWCEPRRKTVPKPPSTLARWGWEVGRGSQGQARPYGYHGRHGKHPGYAPTGFRRLEQLVARLKA